MEATEQRVNGNRGALASCLTWAAEAVMLSLLLLALFTPAWAGDSAMPVLLIAAAPGASMPAMALVNYGAGRQAVVLYPGGKSDAHALVSVLRKHGIERLEALMVPAYSPCHRGSEVLLAAFPTGTAIVTDKSRSPADFSVLDKAAAEGRIALKRVQPCPEGKGTLWSQALGEWQWSFLRWKSGSCRCVLKRLCAGASDTEAFEYQMDAWNTGEFVVTRQGGGDERPQRLLSMPRCSMLQLHRLELLPPAPE